MESKDNSSNMMENVKCSILCLRCFQSKLKELMAGLISKARMTWYMVKA